MASAERRAFGPQQRSFARAGFRPVAVDLPGYGAWPAVAALDFDTLAQDVEAVIARADLDRPVILGHSMGGMIAQTLLRRRPQGYRAAVLACTSAAFGSSSGEFQKKFLADRLRPLERGKSMPELAAEIVEGLIGPAAILWRARSQSTAWLACRSTYRAAVHCLIAFDERGNLGQIEVPVLCLAGGHDAPRPPP